MENPSRNRMLLQRKTPGVALDDEGKKMPSSRQSDD